MSKPCIKSWSFSSLINYESCAFRSYLERVEKIPDTQPKTAADRGTAIHQEAEDYVRGKASLTHNLRHFQSDLAALADHFKAGRVICEDEWGFASDWNIASWRDAWLRLKLDALCTLTGKYAVVVDYKTGKRFGNELKHARQLQLYCVCTLLRYPELEKIRAELWYLDHNELAHFEMTRKQMPRYLSNFDRDGKRMTSDTKFEPNPNIHSCKYCPYAPHKQGDCKYGVNPEAPLNEKPIRILAKPVKSKIDFSAELDKYTA